MESGEIRALLERAWAAERGQRFEEAEKLFAKASSGRPQDPQLKTFHAGVLAKLGRYTEAIAELESVLRAAPSNIAALKWLAVLYKRTSRLNEAIATQEKVVSLDPRDVAGLNQLATMLLESNRFEDAAATLEKLATLHPDEQGYRATLATIYWRLNNADRAIEAQRAEVQLDPANAAARSTLFDYLLFFHRYEELLALTESPKPAEFEARIKALRALGRFTEADQTLLQWLQSDPGNPTTCCYTAEMSLELGDIEGANLHFRTALIFGDTTAAAYLGCVNTGSDWPPGSQEFERMESLLDNPDAAPRDLYQLHLALGACCEKVEEYEQAIAHFDEANQIVFDGLNATRPFAISSIEAQFSQAHGRYVANTAAANESDLPVLVIGMIRSGTSLVEQILASHPNVAGAGEQFYWSERPESGAEAYLELLRSFGPNAKRVVDKMPGNFLRAGEIHRHLPNARFIHIRRHPVDTCLSMWSTYFESPPPFAGSRRNLVEMYRLYLKVMDEWRAVLPPETLLEIDYEDLVADKEPVIRRLMAFCGLDWSDACLHPELRNGRVWTPSHTRVRQPIDTTRVARWKRFEPWLGEFRELLPENQPR